MGHHSYSRSRSRSRSTSRDGFGRNRRSRSDHHNQSVNESRYARNNRSNGECPVSYSHSVEITDATVKNQKEKKSMIRITDESSSHISNTKQIDEASLYTFQREALEDERQTDREKTLLLAQKLMGMRIRIQGCREKPIDRLMKNILLLDSINRPVTPFDNTVLRSDTKAEVEDVEYIIDSLNQDDSLLLLQDLDEVMRLPEIEPFLTYLSAMRAVVVEHMGGNEDDAMAMHASVVEDVKGLLDGKSDEEIRCMQEDIENQLTEGEGMDVDYWGAVLALLRVASFKLVLKHEQSRFMEGRDVNKQRQLEVERRCTQATEQYQVYSEADAVDDLYSPPPLTRTTTLTDTTSLIIESIDDIHQLMKEREMVHHREMESLTCRLLTNRQNKSSTMTNTTSMITKKSHNQSQESAIVYSIVFHSYQNDVDKDEQAFQTDILLPHQVFTWQSKYTPQKPLFFNKMKRGYDWNQYNQIHYDEKNPPPTVIQGYRFNLFYPDLVDKSQRPSFELEPEPGDSNWCVIRFHAGAPYEDVAFRIVNRSWDRGRKSGFRNEFERGILHLYFDFKKYRYKFLQ